MGKMITLNEEEMMMVFGWFNVKAHEVDITQKDINFLKKIQPLLSQEYQGMFERYYERFEKNGY